MGKSIFDLNEKLELELDYIYYNKSISNCIHDNIAQDERDLVFKCTKCFTRFLFRDKDHLWKFKDRIIKRFDFEKAENFYKREVKRLKKADLDDEE
ncbi:hypothetical protein [Spiroplasma diminutum]|uniref:Uncharacterized protein n=1 Tax=Spiroplasma diminutum CUAS-1 TaxID=1276221 RepID=S5MJH8_9MOLU|nr:hypothetical protein [Spiroplasma diminutum]AGR42130.1 hypothetical protein SDIMI_v3c04260 [Spiroplasma diminutum CUAS-1]